MYEKVKLFYILELYLIQTFVELHIQHVNIHDPWNAVASIDLWRIYPEAVLGVPDRRPK